MKSMFYLLSFLCEKSSDFKMIALEMIEQEPRIDAVIARIVHQHYRGILTKISQGLQTVQCKYY